MIDLYRTIFERIQNGVYSDGHSLPTERALAEEFSVARSTVRRTIARLSADGYLETRHGYRPIVRNNGDPAPRNTSPLKAVALLTGSQETYRPFSQIIRGCEMELRKAGYLLVYLDTWAETALGARARGERECEALHSLRPHAVQGLILWCQEPDMSMPDIREIQARGTVVVAIDRKVPSDTIDFVGVDNRSAAMGAVDYLLDLGHRRIAFATALDDHASTVIDREDGYRDALRRRGISDGEPLIYRFPFHAPAETMAEIIAPLAQDPARPSAFFAMNDTYALNLIDALRLIGLRVPEDVSVVGFDDIEAHDARQPFLTTVHQPFLDIGRVAAQTLLQRLAHRDMIPRHVHLRSTFIERSSACPLRQSAPASLRQPGGRHSQQPAVTPMG